MNSVPKGSTSVMARRVEPPDSLDMFPTPPWATRALIEHVLTPAAVGDESCWEPAAGEGHMSEVLAEYFGAVIASDVYDYGKGHMIGSLVGEGTDVLPSRSVDWIITNLPFRHAVEFAERAIECATDGVALLVRSVWGRGR
jgi:hypothetical protein